VRDLNGGRRDPGHRSDQSQDQPGDHNTFAIAVDGFHSPTAAKTT
jgi:hypothetical protein